MDVQTRNGQEAAPRVAHTGLLQTPWTVSVERALAHFAIRDAAYGLDEAQVRSARRRFGPNTLPEQPPTPLYELILEQFKDTLVLILLGSALVSFVLAFADEHDSIATAFVEPLVILFILLGNATVGVVQESRAESAINALQQYAPASAKAVRAGKLTKVDAADLVPGDVLHLAVGDRVPADARLLALASTTLTVDQALLTGESVSVHKTPASISDPGAVKQDMHNLLFSGTTVATGSARALVIATGSHTALGTIHASIADQIHIKTPLKRKLDAFGESLAKVISVVCLAVWLINIRHFADPVHGGALKGAIYYLKIAVALAVAAIPEGLAAVITACLALGTQKMAKLGAIVRNLPSVETLGCTNVICSDKTGTLTTNQMSVARLTLVSDQGLSTFHVQGTSYAPQGAITSPNDKPPMHTRNLRLPPTANRLAEVASLCNDATIVFDPELRTYTGIGEATEAALKVLVEKIGAVDVPRSASLPADQANQRIAAGTSRLMTFEFSRDRKSMSTLVRRADGTHALLVKGAPDSILARCTTLAMPGSPPMSPQFRTQIQDQVQQYGQQGLRTLAFASIDLHASQLAKFREAKTPYDYLHLEQGMSFLGTASMLDPPRPEVRDAVRNCQTAGIRIIVITGDDKSTAEAICRSIGVFGEHEDLSGKSYTGREFESLSSHEKIAAVQRASLFSRTEPLHKSELVDLLQGQGLVVAMTGDGVNDAVALKKADIGIAMGSGTDVAKLAADMVLVNDNFATIEKAVEEGRAIYNNTKQFIRYLISSNIGEVVSIFLTVLLGMPEALIPVQLLWLNLVTDGLPATALGFNPPGHMIMKTAPRKDSEKLINGWLFIRYLIIGTYVGVATVAAYAIWFMYYSQGPQISWYQLTNFHSCQDLFPEIGCAMFTNEMSKKATTMSLSTLVTIEMFNALNSLSENESLLSLPPWSNPYVVGAIVISMALHFMILYTPFLATLFVVTPLSWDEWKMVLYLSAPVILVDEALKYCTLTFVEPPASPETDQDMASKNLKF